MELASPANGKNQSFFIIKILKDLRFHHAATTDSREFKWGLHQQETTIRS